MYDCTEARELLGIYLDDELEAVPTKRVAEHVEACASCRRELEIMRSQSAMLARAVRGQKHDTRDLRASIVAATTGRRRLTLPSLVFARTPAWAVTTIGALIIAFVILFNLPGRTNTVRAHPLYRAAANNHRECLHDLDAPDWTLSRQAIIELSNSFLRGDARLPLSVGDGYALTRARVCDLDGLSFLHLIYETKDGRDLSVFAGRHGATELEGERSVSLDGHSIQFAHASGLKLTGARDGESILLAAADADGAAASALLSMFAD